MDTTFTIPALTDGDRVADIDLYSMEMRKALTLPRPVAYAANRGGQVVSSTSWVALPIEPVQVQLSTAPASATHDLDILVTWSSWIYAIGTDARVGVQVLAADGTTVLVDVGDPPWQIYTTTNSQHAHSRLLTVPAGNPNARVRVVARIYETGTAQINYCSLTVTPLRWTRSGATL